jgi:hypothetical protein
MSAALRIVSAVLLLTTAAIAQNREGGRPAEGEGNRPSAEAQQGPPVKTGRILEAETKGKLTTLKIESTEGESYEVKLTPQLEFFVVGKGDAGFVRPGVYMTARGVMTNETIFVKEVNVVLLAKGKRPPVGKVQKATVKEGESVNTFEVSGQIVEMAPSKDYPDHTAVALKVAGKPPAVWLEPGYTVTVASSDPAHAAAGADVEIGMRPLKGGKLMPVALRVHRGSDFSSAEMLGELEKAEEKPE